MSGAAPKMAILLIPLTCGFLWVFTRGWSTSHVTEARQKLLDIEARLLRCLLFIFLCLGNCFLFSGLHQACTVMRTFFHAAATLLAIDRHSLREYHATHGYFRLESREIIRSSDIRIALPSQPRTCMNRGHMNSITEG